MDDWLSGLACICVISAPAIVLLLAPGFRDQGERFPLAVEVVRLAVPYVAVSGTVAVAVAALNAAGRVAAAAFGLLVFNAVFVVVLLPLLWSNAPPPTVSRAQLAAGLL